MRLRPIFGLRLVRYRAGVMPDPAKRVAEYFTFPSGVALATTYPRGGDGLVPRSASAQQMPRNPGKIRPGL